VTDARVSFRCSIPHLDTVLEDGYGRPANATLPAPLMRRLGGTTGACIPKDTAATGTKGPSLYHSRRIEALVDLKSAIPNPVSGNSQRGSPPSIRLN
jgi:hypothetical protein